MSDVMLQRGQLAMRIRKWTWRTWGKLLMVCGILFIIVNITGSLYFYQLAIERGPKDFLQGNEDLQVSAETLEVFLEGDWITWTKQQPFVELEVTAFDGIPLKGYYLAAQEPTKKTVIFAHGYLGNALDMGLFGQYYYETLGYNIFTPDLRGHGKSGGDYIGFGWHDRLDLLLWIEKIIAQNGPDSEIVLHGLSMGAATVLMASGEQLPEQVKAIVADSAYTSVYDLFAYQMERMFHLPPVLFLPTTSKVTELKANYTFQEASALEQIKKAEVPILLIHGGSDTFVPTEMTDKLYEAAGSVAEKVIFPHANHGEAIVIHRDKYLDTLQRFLAEYISR